MKALKILFMFIYVCLGNIMISWPNIIPLELTCECTTFGKSTQNFCFKDRWVDNETYPCYISSFIIGNGLIQPEYLIS